MTVSEDVGEVELIVRRDQGTVGRVSAFLFLIDRGATPDQDYIHTSPEVEKVIFMTQCCMFLGKK